MKIKKFMGKHGVAMILSTFMVVVGFLVISQMYFTYSENVAMSNSCYDSGGYPIVEKSGLQITSFDCDLDL